MPFGITREGIKLRDYELPRKYDPGIEMETTHGHVHEYEARETAIYSHYNWTEWLTLTWWERARAVAHYRNHSRIEAHYSDAAERSAKRNAAKNER